MDELDDFEIIELTPDSSNNGTLQKREKGDVPAFKDKLGDAMVQNFDKILDLANGYLRIQAMEMEARAKAQLLDKQRALIVDESNAYIAKLNAGTNRMEARLDKVNLMLKNFYIYNNGQMSSEDFRDIVINAINKD